MSIVYRVPTDKLAADPTCPEEVHREARAILNAAFAELPEPRPGLPWCKADDLLNDALLSGDREQALAAIRDWREWHFALFEEWAAR